MSSCCGVTLDPPLRELLLLQTKGRMRRIWKRLSSPRRAIPTSIVAVLMLAYAVQVYIAISFNDSPTTLPIRSIAPIGMFGILALKLLGVCIDRNKSGAGFRHEEVHLLLGGPFSHPQVRLFRVCGHAISIFFASVFAAIFFRFHVPSFVAALSGAYLAMLFTYLVYTSIAVAAVHASERAYKQCRNLGCGFALCLLAYLLYRVSLLGVSNLEFLQAFGDEAVALSRFPVSRMVMIPFAVFTNIVVAESPSKWLMWIGPGLLLNYLALQWLLRTEVWWTKRASLRERREFEVHRDQLVAPGSRGTLVTQHRFRNRVVWLGGSGPIIWRQIRATSRLKGGLGWLLIPLASAFALGGFLAYNPDDGAFQTIAVIVVLTSVFLPGLLPFDFRGDLRGLAALKMMPLSPRSVVLGQLVVPVLLLSGFQLLALSALIVHDSTLIDNVLLTLCFLLPTNTIIIALENLVFLLYPYRMAEFDMQATVRRIVMLMAKFCAIFLAALLCLLAGWGVFGIASATKCIPNLWAVMGTIWKPLLFSTQMAALSCVAMVAISITSWAYQRFDLSEDLPV